MIGSQNMLKKKKPDKNIPAVWFHLHKILKQTKLIYGDGGQKSD